LVWRLRELAPQRLLDVGHADADYAPELLAACSDVTLQDVRAFNAKHVGAAGYQLHVGGVPFPGSWRGRFDVVTCVSVLDHVGLDAYGQVNDPRLLDALVAELRRVTHKGGYLLVTVPVGRPQLTTHPDGGQRVFSETQLRGLFSLNDAWALDDFALYYLRGDRYEVVESWADVAKANYLGWRAQACACLALKKL
jgi:SAM-dependent methyltransferase